MKSKFKYGVFTDYDTGKRYAGFHKDKFTELQALELARFELNTDEEVEILGTGLVRHRIGYIDDEKYNGWWLENIDSLDGTIIIKNAAPVWVVAIKEEL